ncbi:hypothetical protein CHUAL_007902 [Chamberlinius hualienensis]
MPLQRIYLFIYFLTITCCVGQSSLSNHQYNRSIINNDVNFIQHSKKMATYFDNVPTSKEDGDNAPVKQIPTELLRRLKEITSMDELFEKMIEPTHTYRLRSLKSTNEVTSHRRYKKNKKTIKSRINNETVTLDDDEESVDDPPLEFGPIFDKRAFCHPRRQPVNIPQPKDPTLIYQPMCIQIERCGGCCAHELFHCVPSVKRNASRKVVVLRYPHSGAEYFVFETVTKVRVERHTKCQCQCKIQPEDCSSHQIYDRENCRCNCAQHEGHLKCKGPQIWVEKECRCRCPDYTECSTGTYFDTRMCRLTSIHI